jgi:aspartyl-tRNA(Asn)/glutamyl-tRNA(Gln) amidotransferase subunit A
VENQKSVKTVVNQAEAVRRGEVTAVELTRKALDGALAKAELNALLYLDEAGALSRAAEIDAKVRQGHTLGALCGVPLSIKDAICTLGLPTTSASKVLTRDGTYKTGWVPDYDATVVARLKAADAIILAKANMDEFAMGSSNENSAFGPVKNPWDPTRIPGGSSGGSAASVAAEIVAGSLGSDTGGSIRQPAALCGVVGVKPSYGRVSRYGLVAFASSLDQVGPLTSDVQSAARILQVIAGYDDRDATSVDLPVGAYEAACEQPVAGLRIGIPKEYFAEGLDEGIRTRVLETARVLKDQGATLVDVSLPNTEFGISTYYVLATAEASSNLSRFDGVRFGMRVETGGSDLATMYRASRGAGFGPEVKRRIMLGTYALSSGFYDAYYRKAQAVRALIAQDFDTVFARVDALLTPCSPTVAFKLGERAQSPLQMYLADVYTLPASLAGVCGMSVPVGFDADGLPIGAQLLAPRFKEETLFRLGAAWERERTGSV